MACIFVIDDDKMIREMIRNLLENNGHQVVCAENGRLGLELLRQKAADLIITDIFMPEMDGTEFIMDIVEEFPQAKIIAISGGGETVAGDFLSHARLFGADLTFSKPLSLSDLAGAVRELLGEAEQEFNSAA